MNNIIWRNSISKGIFHRHTVEIEQITTEDIELIDEVNHYVTRIPWSEISSVIVMNQHNIGYSNYYGYGVGRYMRNYSGISFHNSNAVGDVAFLDKSGTPRIVFKNIADPHGVQALARAQIK